MLELKNIKKTYLVKNGQPVEALKGINLSFGESGFVSILGQSGCGKTTLLNIIGGLDRYTEGDLIINNQSTSNYTNSDWDLYRNKEIGIVFQSYNLIPQLTVLQNVALALRLGGISAKERDEKAKKALIAVGLEDQINKSPNQLSGGQMQRVAIARALVNEPNFILADEPTGALDSKTSVQVMELLKEISKDKLIIMVTHNEKLAKDYSTRIIELSDGLVVNDTKISKEKKTSKDHKEIIEEKVQTSNKKEEENKKHTSMAFSSAIALSGKNLLTKKGKTIVTSIAASFGIIGVGLVLALSNGFTAYIDRMEKQTLNTFPITVEKFSSTISEENSKNSTKLEAYPDDHKITITEPATSVFHVNNISEDYIRYLEGMNTSKKEYGTIRYNYSLAMNVISSYKSGANVYYKSIDTTPLSYLENMVNNLASTFGSSTSMWQPLPASEKEILELYDIINPGGYLPNETYDENSDEIGLVLVVNTRNNLTTTTMEALGLDPTANKTYTFDEILDLEYKYVPNDYFYQNTNSKTEEKIGIFFKDSITMKDITNIVSTLGGSGDIKIDEFYKLLDLPEPPPDLPNNPTTEQRDNFLKSPIISALKYAIIDNKDKISTYTNIDVSNLDKIGESLNNLGEPKSNSTNDLLAFLKEKVLKKDAILNDKQGFAEFAIKFFRDVATHEAVKDKFTRKLQSKEVPSDAQLEELYKNNNIGKKLKIKAILREKKETELSILHSGIYYPKPLTYQTFKDCNSQQEGYIAHDYKNHAFIGYTYNESLSTNNENKDVNLIDAFKNMTTHLYEKDNMTNDDLENVAKDLFNDRAIYINFREIIGSLKNISSNEYMNRFNYLGSDVVLKQGQDLNDPLTYCNYVSSITIYPNSYDDKLYISDYLNKYNDGKAEKDHIILTDVGQAATQIVGQIVAVISGVLIAFASISLVVSSIMIAILIYSSVIERTKEIGILRSIGARKKDVGRLFQAEGIIVGFLSGLIGVLVTYLLSIPISLILNAAFPTAQLGMIAFLNPLHALLLVAISVLLTFLASLLPSRYAANKDPVLCLRTE